MNTLWADPNKKWDGFHFTECWLDTKVLDLPLTREVSTDKGKGKVQTTVGDVYRIVVDRKCEVEELGLAGPSSNRDMLTVLISFHNDKVDPFSTGWFYYDHDSCMDDPHESYAFFVVHGDKIIRERASFSDYSGSGFDPSVFQTDDRNEARIWMNERDWQEARTKLWYRKFYTETQTGQIMTLRSDEPKLFDYSVHRSTGIADPLLQNVKLLREIRNALIVMAVIGFLILIYLWK